MKETSETNKVRVNFFLKEIQTISSVSYMLAVGIGMVFNYHKFAEFGINIFDYADVLDFLIAPFADVVIIVFTAASLAIAYLLFKLDVYWEKKFPNSYGKLSMGTHRKSWYKTYRYVSALSLFLFYLFVSAHLYGKLMKRKITRRPETTMRYADNEVVKGITIGKTQEIIFLLRDGQVIAIPFTSAVKEFEVK
jgi:hypothetical protein